MRAFPSPGSSSSPSGGCRLPRSTAGLSGGLGCFAQTWGSMRPSWVGGDAAVPVKRRPFPSIERVPELFHQVVLAGEAEDALLAHAVLQEELSTLLHQDGDLVLPEFLLVGHGLCQALAEHR